MSDGREDLKRAVPRSDPAVTRAVAALSERVGGAVVGVGEGRTSEGEPCVVVMLDPSGPAVASPLPEEVEGVPVRIVDSGSVQAREERR
jgi:hypothetical protein